MAAILHQLDQRRLIDTNGIADASEIYFEVSGTDTPAPVYTTAALTTEHPRPIVVASGAAVPAIYLDNSVTYRRRIVYPDGSVDDTDPYNGGAAISSELASTAAGKGAALVALAQGGTVAEAIEYVTPKMFGAAGDGVADDATAIANTLATQKPVDWQGLSYRIASQINHTVTSDLIWRGNGATITFDPAAHAEYGLRLNDATGLHFQIDELTINGSKMANKPLEVLNNTSMTTASTFVANELRVTGAKRSNAFAGGDGVFIRGAFDTATFYGGKVWDCELPASQGTSGEVGITGISVSFYSTTSFVRKLVLDGIELNKIYSSDLAYQDDQDGVKFFGPDDTSVAGKAPTTLVVTGGSRFVNCYGRSIKTQCRSTIVDSAIFERDEGLTSGVGNNEIDAQTGSLVVDRAVFNYEGGFQPGACVRAIGGSTYSATGLIAKNCDVFVETGTTLTTFAQAFGSSAEMARHKVDDIKIHGAVKMPVELLVNGPGNYIEVSNVEADNIALGDTSERALVYVKKTGSITPSFAFVTAHGNVYTGADTVALLRDTISGVSTTSSLSAWDNHGFSGADPAVSTTVGGLKTNALARIGRLGPQQADSTATGSGYVEILSDFVAAGTTKAFPVRRLWEATMLLIVTSSNHALIVSSNSANTVVNKSANVEVGSTTDPGVGTYRIWSSATNELTFSNTSGGAVPVTIFALVAG